MTDDIKALVERLRKRTNWWEEHLANQAADALTRMQGVLAETVPDPEYRRMQDIEIERLREALAAAERQRDEAIAALEHCEYDKGKVQRRYDKAVAALRDIQQWADAYPLGIFREPDLIKARALLEAGGITLDAVSAGAMRHVLKGVGEIARAIISKEQP